MERKFIETELGRIPSDWIVTTIKDAGTAITDGINPQKYRESEFCEYSMPAYDCGMSPNICKGSSMNSNRTKISGEVLLFNKLNVRQRRVWYVENAPANSVCSMEFLAYKSNVICLPLLREILLQDKVTNDFISVSRGTSNSQKRIAPSDFWNYKVAIPADIKEQQRIASCLSSINEMISKLTESIEKKQLIKEGLMQELLTGKKRLEGFHENWVDVQLGSILSYEQPTKYIVDSTDYAESGIPVLTAGKSFILGYTNEKTGIYDNVPVIIFDDFVTESKYVSFSFKAKSSAMKMLSLRDKKLHNLRFIYDVMQLIDFPMTDHKRYWISEYSKIYINIPSSLEEENAIERIMSQIDSEISLIKAEREKYLLIKQGMMQQLLTGKTRL